MSDRMLTPDDAAARLQVTARTVRKWLRNGTMKGIKIGHLWRISEATIAEFDRAAQNERWEGRQPDRPVPDSQTPENEGGAE